jgi:hypothetical protein
MDKSSDDPNLLLFTVLCVGLGGSILALMGLWLEMRLGRRAKRILCGIFFLAFGITATILWVVRQPIAVVGPVLVFGGVSLAAYATQAASVRRWANRIVEPSGIWTLLLLASPLFALGYARHLNRPDPLAVFLTDPGPSVQSDPNAPHAETDLGREVELFHYGGEHSLGAMEEALIELERYTLEVIRLREPNPASNCYGWVFTGGTFCVAGEQVDTILADNGYEPIETVARGDLIVYRDSSGLPAHIGVVCFVGADGIVLVESKSGPLGVFLHTPYMQPYGRQFGFWRSSRPGHRLRGLDADHVRLIARPDIDQWAAWRAVDDVLTAGPDRCHHRPLASA